MAGIHAVLSGSQALERSKTTGASGSAVFTLDDDGTINYMVNTFIHPSLHALSIIVTALLKCAIVYFHYWFENNKFITLCIFVLVKVRLTGLQTEVSAITIEMPSKNRRKIVADIFGNYRDGLVSKASHFRLRLIYETNGYHGRFTHILLQENISSNIRKAVPFNWCPPTLLTRMLTKRRHVHWIQRPLPIQCWNMNLWISFPFVLQAQGKWLRPKLRDVQMFLHGELYVNVATGAFTTSELRGRIVQLPYQGHIRRHASKYTYPTAAVP